MSKTILPAQLPGSWKRGRPRMRQWDEVDKDARIFEVSSWQMEARDRDELKEFFEEKDSEMSCGVIDNGADISTKQWRNNS